VCAACEVALGPNLERKIAKDDRAIAASRFVALRKLRAA
jgi:predicted  nucleic acid-binding Zn-ribbon protein